MTKNQIKRLERLAEQVTEKLAARTKALAALSAVNKKEHPEAFTRLREASKQAHADFDEAKIDYRDLYKIARHGVKRHKKPQGLPYFDCGKCAGVGWAHPIAEMTGRCPCCDLELVQLCSSCAGRGYGDIDSLPGGFGVLISCEGCNGAKIKGVQ